MADFADWPMAADLEVHQTFGKLAEILRPTMEMTDPKRRRAENAEQYMMQYPPNNRGPDLQVLHQMICQVARLALIHEQELLNLKSQDTFVLYLQTDPQGALTLIAAKTEWWNQQRKAGQEVQPLRCILVQAFFQELVQRVSKINKDSTDPKAQEAWKMLRSRDLILEDGSWPFLQWDANQQKLTQVTTKRPLSMDAMNKMLQELVEGFQAVQMTQRFQAMGPTGLKSSPWKLQIGIRQGELYALLWTLCGSAVMHLMGASMKPHHQHMSRQAQLVQQSIGKGRSKGKSTQKGKGKGHSAPSTPSTMSAPMS